SRRRHTRFSRDWSSDVCSSDLCVRKKSQPHEDLEGAGPKHQPHAGGNENPDCEHVNDFHQITVNVSCSAVSDVSTGVTVFLGLRSEERRVGKECRCRWAMSSSE